MDFLDQSRAVRKPNRAAAFLVQQHQIRQAASSGPTTRITSSSRLAAYLAVSQLDRKGVGTFSALSQASSKVEVCSEGAAYSLDKQVDYFRHWVKIRHKGKTKTTVSNQIVYLEHPHYCQYSSSEVSASSNMANARTKARSHLPRIRPKTSHPNSLPCSPPVSASTVSNSRPYQAFE